MEDLNSSSIMLETGEISKDLVQFAASGYTVRTECQPGYYCMSDGKDNNAY